jgi:hypothetical protein
MNDRQGADDQRLDWALREVTGAEAPPDLTAAVLARRAAGDGARLAAESVPEPPRTSRWLAAAAVLLGVGVVVGVAVWPRGDAEPGQKEVPSQQPARPKPAEVSTRAEIEALPADARAVLGTDLDDDAVAALLRLRELRELEIRYPYAMVLGLGLKTEPPKDPRCITAKSFDVFAQLTKLQSLRLRGAYGLTEDFAPRTRRQGDKDVVYTRTILESLEQLPMLEELSLSHFDVAHESLAQITTLPSLRTLDLTANYGVCAESIDTLLKCRSLRSLTLRACMKLPGSAIARLAELPALEELDLGDIDGINWRSAPDPAGENIAAAERYDLERIAKKLRDATERRRPLPADLGVTDDALRGLARAPKLRVLDIAQARCTLDGLAALRDLHTLRELDLSGIASSGGGGGESVADRIADCLPPELTKLTACGDYTDAFCRALREKLPKLAWLELPACYRITDAGLAELVRIPTLRHLDIRQSRGLTATAMASLRTATQLEFLDLRHIDWVTAAHVAELRAALPKLHELQASAQ